VEKWKFPIFQVKDFEAFENKIYFFHNINQIDDLNNEKYFSDIENLIEKKLTYGHFNLSICISDATIKDIDSIVFVF